jgi:predicted molibdopterin-dependent oxidoreductase YjgC
MTDITTTHLEAAFIDQNVAGAFPGKRYAFVAVVAPGGWQLGVAVANEQGYNPISGKTFKAHYEAKEWADGLNKHIGLDVEDALEIIGSTMGGARTRALQ